MEKLILIPYEKYQRMQSNLAGHGETSTKGTVKPSPTATEKTPSETTTDKRPKVSLPPPGVRDIKKRKKKSTSVKPHQEKALDWISF